MILLTLSKCQYSFIRVFKHMFSCFYIILCGHTNKSSIFDGRTIFKNRSTDVLTFRQELDLLIHANIIDLEE